MYNRFGAGFSSVQSLRSVDVSSRHDAQFCSCRVDTAHSCTRIESTRRSVHLVLNRSVSGRLCSVDTVSSRLVLNRSPPEFYLKFILDHESGKIDKKMQRHACQNRKKTGNKSVLLTFIQYDMQFTEIRHKFMIPGGFHI